METQFEKMIGLLVEHGGDAGGAYFSFPEGLEESVNFIKDALGLTDYRVAWGQKVEINGQIHFIPSIPFLVKK